MWNKSRAKNRINRGRKYILSIIKGFKIFLGVQKLLKKTGTGGKILKRSTGRTFMGVEKILRGHFHGN